MYVHLPKEIEHYEGELRYFFETMIWKLHISRHKGFTKDHPLNMLRDRIDEELQELDGAIFDGSQFDALLESVDVANQSFLLGLSVMQKDKAEYEKERTEASDLSFQSEPRREAM